MIRLLDTHCHLDAYPDPRAVLVEADAAAVDIVAVSETPEAYRRLRTRLGRTSSGVAVALGLHPASRAAAAPGQLERFLRMLPDAPWVGEVGLDFAPGTERREKTRQTRDFAAVLDHSLSQAKPMTVHSRGAAKESVTLLAQAGQRAVLHWYSGDFSTADAALAAGLWFSINPAMTRSAKGQALIGRLPSDRVLCETDGPYCSVGRRVARPSDVNDVARSLARAWSGSEADARARLSSNVQAFLSAEPVDPPP
jgi:TatD DNase family protein